MNESFIDDILKKLEGVTVEFIFHAFHQRHLAIFTKEMTGKLYHYRAIIPDGTVDFRELMMDAIRAFDKIEQEGAP